MATRAGIVNGCGLGIDTRHGNQLNKSKLELYNVLIHCNSCYKQLYLINKTEYFSYKGGCGICKCTHIKLFKEELAWAIDERLQVISMLFETVIPLRN